MAQNCKHCGLEIEWGFDGTRWVPLEPTKTDHDLPRTFLDENQLLRADHRDRHVKNGSGVNITRLDKKVPAELANEHQAAIVRSATRKRKAAEVIHISEAAEEDPPKPRARRSRGNKT